MDRFADFEISPEIVDKAVDCLKRGGVLLHPTETVYGLGGDARLSLASSRIREIKGNDPDKPLLVLTDDWSRVKSWIANPDLLTPKFVRFASTNAATILLPASKSVPPSLIGKSSQIAIRVSAHPLCVRLVQAIDGPLSSTSANSAGVPATGTFQHVEQTIVRMADFAIDGGVLPGIPSMILQPTETGVNVIRSGALSSAEIQRMLA